MTVISWENINSEQFRNYYIRIARVSNRTDIFNNISLAALFFINPTRIDHCTATPTPLPHDINYQLQGLLELWTNEL